MKYIITLLLASQISFAQNNFTKVDMKQVEKEIKSAKSIYYYPTLLAKYNALDTTLRLEDYRMIYFGFVFSDTYSIYGDDKTKEINEELKLKNYDKALIICDSVLLKNPVSLRANYLKAHCILKRNKSDSLLAYAYYDRYDQLMNAIASTGNGLSCKTGFKVTSISDEYEMMYNFLEIEKYSGQALVDYCDLMSVEPSKLFKEKDLYFDAEIVLKKESELFDKK